MAKHFGERLPILEVKSYSKHHRFQLFHPEKIESALTRYRNEIRRVFGVLESALTDRQWLVGDKMTFADMSFVTWNSLAPDTMGTPDKNLFDEFPNVKAWHERMTERPAWKKIWQTRTEWTAEEYGTK